VTVAETLSGAGFGTYAVVASYPVHHVFGFDQGFDVYRDEFLPDGRGGRGAASPAEARDQFYFLAETVTDTALELLDQADKDKQFFWVHYYDPHPPYGDSGDGERLYPKNVQASARDGDARHLLERSRELYDGDVQYLDTQLDRLLRRLASDEGRMRTHVVVTADHGEAFGEDGSVGHGARILPSTIHVPLVIRSPLAEPGVRSDVASTVDLAATLLALAGVERSTPRGRVLVYPPTDNGEAVGMRRTYEKPFAEIRLDGKGHFVPNLLFFHVDSRGRLVRGNSQRIMDRVSPDTAAELRDRFLAFEQGLAAHPDTRIAPGVREALQALGYAP
jgi:arylsulfatase